MCGTPGYVAPEILHGEMSDSKSDIFSIGVIFYNILTGRALFPGMDHKEILKKNSNNDLKNAMKCIINLPSQAQDFLLKLLVTDKKKRPTAK